MAIDFVRSEMLPPKAPPVTETGILGWMRRRLFATPVDTLLTLFGLYLIYVIVPPFINFALVNANFSATNGAECRPEAGMVGGACWSYVSSYFRLFVYGRFPVDELWRPNLVFIFGLLLLVPLLMPKMPYKGVNAFLFFVVYPVITLILLSGGGFHLTGFFVPFLNLFGESQANFVFELALVTALISGAIILFGKSIGEDMMESVRTIIAIAVIIGALGLILSTDYGLSIVETSVWGGFLVTLVVAVTGIVVSLPIGIFLALGRQSNLPAVRLICVVFIEFWRGVPLVSILFMAQNMIPLFLAEGGESIDNLLRALIGVALFASAYMAEVVRGGLQALPKGQYEGANSLGLSYWQMMRKIILPQALKYVIPGIVNTFIGLFKDTTLVSIVGIFDLLGIVQSSFSDPSWAFPLQASTGYLFVAIVFFIFCFGMSRYSIFMENLLHTGHKR